MKKQTTLCLVASLIGAAAVFAQTTATTTPVGYITCNINGVPVGFKDATTYIAPSLVEKTEFAGLTESAATNVLTFSGGVPTTFDGSYVLEITSGASEGWWSTVTSSTATTITLNDNFPAGLSAGVAISVRKHSTLFSFLGNNSPGLTTYDGVRVSDEVHILNPATQGSVVYAYVAGADLGDPAYPDGVWLNLATSEYANNVVIEPGAAVRAVRKSAAGLSFVAVGTVKTTNTQVDVYPDYNWFGTPLAVGNTLNGMALNDQLHPYDGVTPNYDNLQIVDAAQKASVYAAYDTTGEGGPMSMLDLATSEDAGSVLLTEGTGAVIFRTGNPASTITIPGTVVAP